jgi:signal transduction histidine kinase
MEERARRLDGKLEIRSSPDQGTTVHLEVALG